MSKTHTYTLRGHKCLSFLLADAAVHYIRSVLKMTHSKKWLWPLYNANVKHAHEGRDEFSESLNKHIIFSLFNFSTIIFSGEKIWLVHAVGTYYICTSQRFFWTVWDFHFFTPVRCDLIRENLNWVDDEAISCCMYYIYGWLISLNSSLNFRIWCEYPFCKMRETRKNREYIFIHFRKMGDIFRCIPRYASYIIHT